MDLQQMSLPPCTATRLSRLPYFSLQSPLIFTNFRRSLATPGAPSLGSTGGSSRTRVARSNGKARWMKACGPSFEKAVNVGSPAFLSRATISTLLRLPCCKLHWLQGFMAPMPTG